MKALFALTGKERVSFYILAFLLFVYFVLGLSRAGNETDFQDFYNAAENYLGHEDLYHIESSKKAFGKVDFLDILKENKLAELMSLKGKLGSYIYPPTFAFLLQPLALLTYEAAATIFFLAGFFSLLGIYYLLYSREKSQEPFFHLLLVTISSFLFLESHLNNNQVGLILLALILLAVFLKNDPLRGLLFSLAIVIKLIPAVFGLYFLARRQWKMLFFSGLFLVFWVLLPFVSGTEYNIMLLDNWYNLVIENFVKSPIFRAWKNNQSLMATLAKYFVNFADPLNQIKYGLPFVDLSMAAVKGIFYAAALSLVSALGYVWFKKRSERQLIAGLFILSVLLSGISWVHTFVFFIYPAWYLWKNIDWSDKAVLYPLFAATAIPFLFISNGRFFMMSGLLYTGLLYYYLVLRVDEKTN